MITEFYLRLFMLEGTSNSTHYFTDEETGPRMIQYPEGYIIIK